MSISNINNASKQTALFLAGADLQQAIQDLAATKGAARLLVGIDGQSSYYRSEQATIKGTVIAAADLLPEGPAKRSLQDAAEKLDAGLSEDSSRRWANEGKQQAAAVGVILAAQCEIQEQVVLAMVHANSCISGN